MLSAQSVVTGHREGAMKFGKRLKRQMEETLPEWRGNFLRYKDLKKLVRRISAEQPSPETEAEFVQLLNAEVDKFNAFFVEQEEEFIIRQRELQDGIKRASGGGERKLSEADYVMEMGRIRKDFVNLHGEMVLLENYSSINYTGLAKILKKYDKRTGGLLRLPFIDKVLKQPFFTTDIISNMVKECEATIEAIFPVAAEADGQEIADDWAPGEQSVFRNAVVALMTMQEMRRGSSTYGHFSLPPLSLPSDADLLQFFQLPSPIIIL